MPDNKALMRRFYDEVINGGNLDLIDERLTPDFVDHEQLPGVSPGREGVRQFFIMIRSAFPDLRFEVDELIAEGDKVVALATVSGTHQGEFLGAPATGKKVNVTAIDIIRFADGKGVEHWGVMDAAAMMEQLGVAGATA